MLIILRLGSNLGLLIMNGAYFYFYITSLHDLIYKLLDYTINMIQIMLHAAH